MMKFISHDLLAMTIITIKNNLFEQDYITIEEFNYIQNELQKEFNKEQKEIIIHSDFNKFSSDNIKISNSIITVVENPYIYYVANSIISEYAYIISELIMEYAEQNLKQQKEKFTEFKNKNHTFEDKQKTLLKTISNN